MELPWNKGALVIALLVLGGCDPAFRFAGRVTTPGGEPAIGAEVWLECGEGDKSFRSTTNSAGRFECGGVGWRPASCLVRARATGSTASVPIMSVCKKRPSHLEDACLEIVADSLVLAPDLP